VAVVGLAWLPSSAQVKGDGAAKMIQLKPIQTVADAQAVQPGDSIVMACPKCKNSWITVVEKPAKTGAPESKMVARHECPGCETKLVTEGTGKQAKDVVKHVCKSCGSEDAFCCVMKKGAGPTPGMDKK
jgi:uncharacterized protein YbaR (Trm112 family)